jgi:hypothetical protein
MAQARAQRKAPLEALERQAAHRKPISAVHPRVVLQACQMLAAQYSGC